MPDPIIKIKKRSLSSGFPNNLQAGELAVNLFTNSFYIGTGGNGAITFGSEIDTSPTLASNSDNKIPTQKAVKSYIDNYNTSSSFQVALRVSNVTQLITNNTNSRIQFPSENFNTITGLSYGSGGTFYNISGNTMFINVSYQIGFSANSTGYRATWIQTSGIADESKYGALFTTPNGNTAHVHNGSSVIPVHGSNGQFAIFAAQNSGSPNLTGHPADEFKKNKVDIFKFA
jgi:hypothetical protein